MRTSQMISLADAIATEMHGLDTGDPDRDALMRGAMLQVAELVVTEIYWPEFGAALVHFAESAYANRRAAENLAIVTAELKTTCAALADAKRERDAWRRVNDDAPANPALLVVTTGRDGF